MYLRSAPAAKNPEIVELTTSVRASLISNASSAASSASTSVSPSALAGALPMTRCMTAPGREVSTRSLAAIPVHRTRDQDMAREAAPEHALNLGRGGDQRLQVDSGLDPHLREHRDEVLAGDVAGRARRHRAAPELPERRFEAADAGFERGQAVG